MTDTPDSRRRTLVHAALASVASTLAASTTAVAQSGTPAPSSGVGGTSYVAYALIGIGALYAVHRFTNIDLLGLIPSVGGGGGGSSGGGGGGLLGGGNLLILVATALMAALVAGAALGAVPGLGVQLVIGLELLAAYLLLREFGLYSFKAFAVIAVLTAMAGFAALGEPVFGYIATSDVFPLIVIAVLYFAYQGIRAATRKREIVISADTDGDDDGDTATVESDGGGGD